MNKPNVEELHIESAGALASLPVDVDKIDPDNFSNSFKRHCIRKVDMRLVPLCSFAYLMNYLDRSNIGNSKILNQETGDSLLQQTGITEVQYSIILTVFGIAYTLFDIPSNWIMKRYTRPSHWLGFLMLSWGCLTIGFAWVNNFATVLAIRFLIGVFEAGFFPGGLAAEENMIYSDKPRHRLPYYLLVPSGPAIPAHRLRSRVSHTSWSFRGLHRLRCGLPQQFRGPGRFSLAVHNRRNVDCALNRLGCSFPP